MTGKNRRPRHRMRQETGRRILLVLLMAALLAAALLLCLPRLRTVHRLRTLESVKTPSWIEQAYIPIGNARKGQALEAFDGIVIHYVGNPGTTAMNNRNYFAMSSTEVVSHFVVGLDGEIVQCLPLHERSVASNSRNRDTISIEVCHPDEGGQFTAATYQSLVKLTAWLCDLGGLEEDAVIRHYDITGKECPRYYVRHPAAWDTLLADIKNARENR